MMPAPDAGQKRGEEGIITKVYPPASCRTAFSEVLDECAAVVQPAVNGKVKKVNDPIIYLIPNETVRMEHDEP